MAQKAGASTAGAVSSSYSLGKGTSESGSMASGLGGVAKTGGGAMRSVGATMTAGLKESYSKGQQAGVTMTGGSVSPSRSSEPTSETNAQPEWAKSMKRNATMAHAGSMALHAARDGDAGMSADSPNLSEKD